MDLGISGRKAIVCGASKGLGKGCAAALAREGFVVVIVARGADALEATAREIRQGGSAQVQTVVADVTTAEGRDQLLETCPDPDILITNAAGPPAGDFREWTKDTWVAAFEANMLAPIELIRRTVDTMISCRFGRIINITSSAVKAPIDVLGLSNGARSGLTGFVAGLARKTVAHNVTINNVLPGLFDTDRLDSIIKKMASDRANSADNVRGELMAQTPAGRFGNPDEFGAVCAFLASRHAGFITGQNILLDGGAYPGTF